MTDHYVSIMPIRNSTGHIAAWSNFTNSIRNSGAYDGITDPREALAVVRQELKKYNASLKGGVVSFATPEDKFQFMLIWG